MRKEIPFAGGYSPARSARVNASETENLYLEKNSKKGAVLYSFPGLNLFNSAFTGAGRSDGVVMRDRGYLVVGSDLLQFDKTGNVNSVGTLASSAGAVSIAAGENFVMMVDGTKGYLYGAAGTATVTFSQITDVDFPDCDFVTALDQYFVVGKRDTGDYYISDLANPVSWQASKFAAAEYKSDYIARPIAHEGRLLLVGDYTTELHYDSGNYDFPFEPYINERREYGTSAPWSIASGASKIFAIAREERGGNAVFMIAGQSPMKISTPDIEWQLQEMSDAGQLDDAIGFTWVWSGHTFYNLLFPSANKSWCYDVTTGAWSIRTTGNGMWRARGHLYLGGKHYFTDYENGNIYTIDSKQYTDNGTMIRRRRRVRLPGQGSAGTICHSFQVMFEPAVGLSLPPGTEGENPQAILRMSDDGAKTWGADLEEPLGRLGEYDSVTLWNRLGYYVDRVVEIEVNQPVNVTMMGAYADLEGTRE